MVLKLAANRPSSSRRSMSIDASRSWVSATCSAAAVRRSTGRSTTRATTKPSAPARAMPPSATRMRVIRSDASVLSISARGRAIWTAAPVRVGIVIMRKWWPPADTLRITARLPLRAMARSSRPTGSSIVWSAGALTVPSAPMNCTQLVRTRDRTGVGLSVEWCSRAEVGPVGHPCRLFAQRAVGLVEEAVAHGDVRDPRRERDRDRHRCGGEHRETGPQAHDPSRRT